MKWCKICLVSFARSPHYECGLCKTCWDNLGNISVRKPMSKAFDCYAAEAPCKVGDRVRLPGYGEGTVILVLDRPEPWEKHFWVIRWRPDRDGGHAVHPADSLWPISKTS